MYTYYLGFEEVSQYSKDFSDRLEKLDTFPTIWCPVGQSGSEITEVIAKFVNQDRVQVVPLSFDRNNGTISLENQEDASSLKDASVLVIDSSVHSGTTMFKAVQQVEQLGASKITSYSLVVKKGSCFIPNFFGLLIGDHDRAYYLLQSIPNNRLVPFGIFRKITQEDVRRKSNLLHSGLESIDNTSGADLWYDSIAKSNHVYLYEQRNKIYGFISFLLENDSLFIDAIAVDKLVHGQDVGGSLMRWAEAYARLNNCHSIFLWAINKRKDFYQHMGFKSTSNELDLGEEQYTMMQRRLLYNIGKNGTGACSHD